MKKIIKLSIIGVLAILWFSGCSTMKVISDKDSSEDFTQFKTFEFMGWADNSDQALTRFDKERIEEAFRAEAEIRGLSPAKKDGDIIVTLFVTGEMKTQKSATTTTTGMAMAPMGRGMRGPGWGWGAGMTMSQSHTVINETNYLVGTLMLEIFDRKDKELIFQAMGTKTIEENPEKRARQIPKMVGAIMQQYPVKPIK